MSNFAMSDDRVDALHAAIDLIVMAPYDEFDRAVAHLPGHLQDSAFEARELLDAVASAIVSRRIGASVRREVEELENTARLNEESADAATAEAQPCSRVAALPPELRAHIAAASWCSTLSELPHRHHTMIARALWREGDRQSCGRLRCVSRSFHSDWLSTRMTKARDVWLRSWLCIQGLPVSPVAEHGRRVYELSTKLRGVLNERAKELYPDRSAMRAIARFWSEQDLRCYIGAYVFRVDEVADEVTYRLQRVAGGTVYVQCCTDELAEMLREHAVGLTADDDHYTLDTLDSMPRTGILSRRRSSDPPPEPIARHALTVRAAVSGDIEALSDRSSSTIWLDEYELTARCTDTSRYECENGGMWAPRARSEVRRRPSRKSRAAADA